MNKKSFTQFRFEDEGTRYFIYRMLSLLNLDSICVGKLDIACTEGGTAEGLLRGWKHAKVVAEVTSKRERS